MTTKNKKHIKIGLMGTSFDNTNMGVGALASASIKCIFNRWPDAEVILLGTGRFPGLHNLIINNKEISIKIVPIRFCKNIFLSNHYLVLFCYALFFKVFPWEKIKRFCTLRNETLQNIIQMDLVVDITGGDSFSDIYGLPRFFWGFLNKILPILFGKEFVMMPQTYGPFRNWFAKILARYILRKTKVIFSRDQDGADTVYNLLSNSIEKDEVKVVPDVAFVLDSQKPMELDVGSLITSRTDKTITVGLNISGLLYYGGYTNSNMFGLKEDYKQIICMIVDSLLAEEEVLVLLIPHVFPVCGKTENDVAACQEIFEEYSRRYPERIYMTRGIYDQCQIKYIIGLCDFFLGSRMHACIAALSQNIPAVGLAYSKKFSGVFGSVGVADQVIDLRNKDMAEIYDCVQRSFKERDQVAQKLSQNVSNAQKCVLSFLKQIEVD